MSEWQPINTAPLNRRILVADEHHVRGVAAFRSNPIMWANVDVKNVSAHGVYLNNSPGPSGWVYEASGTWLDDPSYWMPLPDPPRFDEPK